LATLVDSSALVALVSASDAHHGAATSALPELARSGDLVTHNYVVVETTALVDNRLGRAALRDLHERLLPPIPITWVDESTHAAAVSALLVSRGPSFVDLVSFEVMRRLRIDRAFAFDQDFADHGFKVVP
jgi:predicted nucleic acid-binding protein